MSLAPLNASIHGGADGEAHTAPLPAPLSVENHRAKKPKVLRRSREERFCHREDILCTFSQEEADEVEACREKKELRV